MTQNGKLLEKKERFVMNSEEIIEMAIQAGISEEIAAFNIPIIEAFAKLVADKALAHRTEPKVCCQQYDTCLEPCIPRGWHLAQRTWVGLTDDEFDYLRDNNFGVSPLISAVEAKLKQKNG